METLQRAYKVAKQNNGAPGIDGVTFEAIEQAGLEGFLQQIHQELVNRTYRPTRNRKKEIPKGNGKSRILGIPTIKDRVVQGALKTSSTVRAEKNRKNSRRNKGVLYNVKNVVRRCRRVRITRKFEVT